MATIKIKFKNTLTLSNFDISINFTCNGVSYIGFYSVSKFGGHLSYTIDSAKYQSVYTDGWESTAYQVIEIDPTQPNFQTFITAMKDNILGVELEAGTYKWNDTLTKFPSTDKVSFAFQYTCDNLTYSYMYAQGSGGTRLWYGSTIVYQFDSLTENLWTDNKYKIITISLNQYVKYDFYNYAILGGNLVKQATEITYTCKWYLDGTLVNTSTFTHEQLTGVDYNVVGSVFKVMLSASVLAQYDYGVNLNGETSNASLGSDNVITIEAFKSNIVFNITSNGTTTLATKNTYVPCDIDFNVNVPIVQLQEKSEYITSNTQTIITPDTGKALSKVTITTDVPQMTEVATSAEMDAKLKEDNVSLYYKYTGTTDDKYTNGDIYQVQEE